jgi:hypothetical protein
VAPVTDTIVRWLRAALPLRRANEEDVRPATPSSSASAAALPAAPPLRLVRPAQSADPLPLALPHRAAPPAAGPRSTRHAARRAAEAHDPAPAPVIEVTIGRVEVRAEVSGPKPAPRRAAPPAMTLEDYLRRRRGGERE